MPLFRRIAASMLVLALVAVAAPGQSATLRVSDPAGDGTGPGLDITSLRVNNADYVLVVRVRFVRAVHGDLVTFVRTRQGMLAAVVSEHLASGDATTLTTVAGETPCAGLRTVWDHAADVAVVTVPSRCLRGGNYGALKVRVLTEIGQDADLAPKTAEGAWRWTRLVPRG
jgi:hypothetical protein